MIYLLLFLEFLKIGLFTFGGGYAMIPLIRETVVARMWLTENEFYDFIGIEERPELDEMGWAPTDEGEFWIEFNHVPKDLPDGRRCYIIDMPFEPRVNFDDYY